MDIRNVLQAWVDGCGQLLAYDNIPVYRRLSWVERKRLDHRFALILILSHSFWRGALGVAVVSTLIHVAIWRYDIGHAGGDVLRALPTLFSIPWIMSARKKNIVALLRFRETAHRHPRRDE